MAVTFLGHTNLRGEELRVGSEPPAFTRWQDSREVAEALASELSPEAVMQSGSLIPLTELERASRSIYW